MCSLFAVEELLDHGLYFWDSGRASHKHHLMHVLLLGTSVLQTLLHEAHGITEVVPSKLREACSGNEHELSMPL